MHSPIGPEPARRAPQMRIVQLYDLHCLGCGAAAQVVLECIDPAQFPLRCLGCRSDAVLARTAKPGRAA